MANDKDQHKDDNLTVYVAVYDSTDAALADLKDIENLHKEELVGTYDAAVVDRKDGKPHVVKRMDNPAIRIIPEASGGSPVRKADHLYWHVEAHDVVVAELAVATVAPRPELAVPT
jgi:hypothetical protein